MSFLPPLRLSGVYRCLMIRDGVSTGFIQPTSDRRRCHRPSPVRVGASVSQIPVLSVNMAAWTSNPPRPPSTTHLDRTPIPTHTTVLGSPATMDVEPTPIAPVEAEPSTNNPQLTIPISAPGPGDEDTTMKDPASAILPSSEPNAPLAAEGAPETLPMEGISQTGNADEAKKEEEQGDTIPEDATETVYLNNLNEKVKIPSMSLQVHFQNFCHLIPRHWESINWPLLMIDRIDLISHSSETNFKEFAQELWSSVRRGGSSFGSNARAGLCCFPRARNGCEGCEGSQRVPAVWKTDRKLDRFMTRDVKCFLEIELERDLLHRKLRLHEHRQT